MRNFIGATYIDDPIILDSGYIFDICSSVNVTTSAQSTWVHYFDFEETSTYVRYVASLYWAKLTIMTIGDADIRAVNLLERAFSIILHLVSIVLYGSLVAKVVS